MHSRIIVQERRRRIRRLHPDDPAAIGGNRRGTAAIAALAWAAGLMLPALAKAQPSEAGTPTEIRVPAGATVETLFKDFLHYARLGRFTTADAYGRALLAHPELDPAQLIELADKDPRAVETLITLIRRSALGDTAQQVLTLLHEGEAVRRQSPERILQNIKLLGGNPQQEMYAVRNLIESGEYAIPLIIEALHDARRTRFWPRIVNALPAIGKPAVNPLVAALSMNSNDVRLNVIEALGEIGYPQAIPYLRKLIGDDAIPAESKAAARQAIERIGAITGRSFPDPADVLFFDLGRQYYEEWDAVRADPRLETANVWYWNESEQRLVRVAVPQRIFGQVMAMRVTREALHLRPDYGEALALWLAANVRREHRLGFNVESGDPDETGETDPTRPAVFPRALYFTQAAGPRYAHMVLERAVRDNDSFVALGAIAALRVTAGEASLIGTEDYKQPLVQALQFPDLLVRIRAALALGAALPRSRFAGDEHVVGVLASALGQSGREQIVVVEPDQTNRSRIAGALRDTGGDVVADADFFTAMDRARTEMPSITGMFLAADIADPGLTEAMYRLRREFIFSKLPVVVLIKPEQSSVATELAELDPYVELALAGADADDLLEAFARVQARTGRAPIDEEFALSLALESAEVLRRIAVDGRTVFDLADAEPALIAALESPEERLQTLCASVLALIPTETAQRAVAHVALDAGFSKSLRVAAFGSLAESARNFGNLLEESQIAGLVDIAKQEPDLTLRTAASQALGALNLTSNKASEIIRSFHEG